MSYSLRPVPKTHDGSVCESYYFIITELHPRQAPGLFRALPRHEHEPLKNGEVPKAWERASGCGKCPGHLHLLGVGGSLDLVPGHLAHLRLGLALGRLRLGLNRWGEPPAVGRSSATLQCPE